MKDEKDAGAKMNEQAKTLRQADSRMLVQITVEELRGIVGEVVEQTLKARLAGSHSNGLLNAEQAAAFLGYSKDWVYKNWPKIGGRRIGGKGVRFDAAELHRWVESRKAV